MRPGKFLVATNYVRGSKLAASAVVYSERAVEPSFTYALKGRNRTAHLYRRGDALSAEVDAALAGYIRSSAVSCSLLIGHPSCPPETVLELAVMRAFELWVCRQPSLPALSDIKILLPTKKKLSFVHASIEQCFNVKDWHTASARVLCRNYLAKE